VLTLALALASGLITAIIAALALSEAVAALRLSRRQEVGIIVAGCFAIGLGAALTPLGEPLATLAVAKLREAPHFAGFGFLFSLLAAWVFPLLVLCSVWAAWHARGTETSGGGLHEHGKEVWADVFWRGGKIYAFVAGLVLLGEGFTPLVERYVLPLPAGALYWVNSISAVLDNATLAAAEINPAMTTGTLRAVLMGLLLAGGMLIPGNIPNIICASKLGIRSREWARLGLPVGLVLMAAVFGALWIAGL
jgi:predicted cation transporter